MKSAVLLCGGSGSRLSPITPTYTKSLIPIKGDKTNLENLIEICFRSGVTDIVLIVPPDRKSYYEQYVSESRYIRIIANYKAYTCNNITTFAIGISNINRNSSGSYFIDGDTYITEDYLPRHDEDTSVFFAENREHEWGFYTDSTGKITDFNKDCTGLCMSGVSYLNRDTIVYLREKLTFESVDESDYWEEFLRKNLDKVTVYYQQVNNRYTLEYDNIIDLMNINGVVRTLMLIPGMNKVYYKMNSMTNDNYLVDYMGDNYVIRIPGVGSDDLTHRSSEEFIYDQIKNMDITPGVKYIGSGAVDLKLSKYLSNYVNWRSIDELEYIPEILKKVSKIHSLGEDERVYYLNVEYEIGKYIGLCDKDKLDTSDINYICNTYEEIVRYRDIFNNRDNITIVHGDLINSNILVNSDGNVYLIDFEYASNCDFNWDLGDLLSEMSIYNKNLDDDYILMVAGKIAVLYNNICGSNKTDVSTIMLWGAITHYIWSIWGYARTTMGDDQLDYARRRIHECHRFLEIMENYNEK